MSERSKTQGKRRERSKKIYKGRREWEKAKVGNKEKAMQREMKGRGEGTKKGMRESKSNKEKGNV